MGKLVDDAKAVADAATALVAEAETEESGTVSDKTVFKVTITYTDGTSVDFTPVVDESPEPAPVAPPVTADSVDSGANTGATDVTPTPPASGGVAEVPEGATEVEPTVAGVVPEQP